MIKAEVLDIRNHEVLISFSVPETRTIKHAMFTWDQFPERVLPEIYVGRLLKCTSISETYNRPGFGRSGFSGFSGSDPNHRTIVMGWDFDDDPLGIGKTAMWAGRLYEIKNRRRDEERSPFFTFREVKSVTTEVVTIAHVSSLSPIRLRPDLEFQSDSTIRLTSLAEIAQSDIAQLYPDRFTLISSRLIKGLLQKIQSRKQWVDSRIEAIESILSFVNTSLIAAALEAEDDELIKYLKDELNDHKLWIEHVRHGQSISKTQIVFDEINDNLEMKYPSVGAKLTIESTGSWAIYLPDEGTMLETGDDIASLITSLGI